MVLTLGDPSLHFFLTRSVARAMGANLGDALRAGHLDADTYAVMVARCQACPRVNACQSWLAESAVGHRTPPEGCPNASVFSALVS